LRSEDVLLGGALVNVSGGSVLFGRGAVRGHISEPRHSRFLV
jgi:hypothetical protein